MAEMFYDDDADLVARAVQFFLPGVPQVYYVGLLAGHNDMALLQKSGVGRDINRHRYTPAEIAADLQRPVVQALLGLIRLRNEHPAFGGQFSVTEARETTLPLQWIAGDATATLHVDFAATRFEIQARSTQGEWRASSDNPLGQPALA